MSSNKPNLTVSDVVKKYLTTQELQVEAISAFQQARQELEMLFSRLLVDGHIPHLVWVDNKPYSVKISYNKSDKVVTVTPLVQDFTYTTEVKR